MTESNVNNAEIRAAAQQAGNAEACGTICATARNLTHGLMTWCARNLCKEWTGKNPVVANPF